MKKLTFANLAGCLLAVLSFSLCCGASSSPVRIAPVQRIASLAEQCRRVIVQDPLVVEALLPILHSPDLYFYEEKKMIPALRLSNALMKRISARRLYQMQGHTDKVTAIAFSPDDSLLASGSAGGTVKLWDSKYQKCILTLQADADSINAVAFDPTGNTVVSGSNDGRVQIWDCRTGICKKTLNHQEFIQGSQLVKLSFDGNSVIRESSDWQLRCVLDAHTGSCDEALTERCSMITFPDIIEPNIDGTCAAMVINNKIILYNKTNKTNKELVHPEDDYIASMAFSRDGTQLIVSLYNRPPCIWNLQTNACEEELHEINYNGYFGKASILATNSDNSMIAATGDRIIRLWTDYQHDMQQIKEHEQQFLLTAARDWDEDRAHSVARNNPILQELVARFPYLHHNNRLLFIPIASQETNHPVSSSSVAESILPVDQQQLVSQETERTAISSGVAQAVPEVEQPRELQLQETARAISPSSVAQAVLQVDLQPRQSQLEVSFFRRYAPTAVACAFGIGIIACAMHKLGIFQIIANRR